eukprot:gene8318-9890_t
MRQGCYELLVLGGDGVKFEECEIDGKSFVRAEPGKEYKVKFIIHRNASGCFPFLHAKCVLTVDGTAVDNGRCVDLDPSRAEYCCLFSGFRMSVDAIQALTFSEIAVGSADSTLFDAGSKAGLLQVTVFEMERSDQLANASYNWTPVAPAVSTVSENKKFWQQPSLATTRGRELKVSASLAKFIYKKLRQVPDVTVEIQCHTGGVLDFLREQHNKLHAPSASNSSAVPANTPPLHIDLSAEPEVVPKTESVALPPVVVDLRQDQKEVKIEMKRTYGRGDAYKLDVDTMVVDLMQDEEEKVVEVKIEKKTKGKSKGGNKKKRAVGVGLGGRGALKKARGAGGTDGADNNATGDVVANKD